MNIHKFLADLKKWQDAVIKSELGINKEIMNSENKGNWDNLKITIGGKEIQAKSIVYYPTETIEQLEKQLIKSEEKEDFESCAKIRDQIQLLKNRTK